MSLILLRTFRTAITLFDYTLLFALTGRTWAAKRIGMIKQEAQIPLENVSREQVVKKRYQHVLGLFFPGHPSKVDEISRSIIGFSKDVQKQTRK